jgi:hypothetical protein
VTGGDSVGRFDNGNTARIIELMPERPASAFRLSPLARRRLKALAEKMDKPESQIVELAITHMAGTYARDLPLQVTVPDEDPDPAKAHKAARRAS